jgi:lipopolysaccharide/colanic/teichoic acid biosynthesis glycosyltransferase
LDILLSALALLALSPLFVIIAIAIRLDSSGPIFFKHLRAGRGGRPFTFYKFRSMIPDAEERRAGLASQNIVWTARFTRWRLHPSTWRCRSFRASRSCRT